MCGENGEKTIFNLLSPLVKTGTILPMNRFFSRKNSKDYELEIWMEAVLRRLDG
jgi:hypothetical protein